MPIQIAHYLLDWYKQHARSLPWRDTPSPYRTWVSEIMLQQTRVETVLSYFNKWMIQFPTVNDLANAEEKEVLNMWEGLGYYRRAHNMRHAARMIMEKYHGEIPQDRKLLERLPGIGKYTAGAILSIAFGKDETAVDGNISRIFTRLFNISEPVNSSIIKNQIEYLVRQELPPGKAGDFNQAMMDLGASICLPRNPDCACCPLLKKCAAYGLNVQEERPVKKPKAAIPHFKVTAAILQDGHQFLLAQRPHDGLLGGLWEFPGGKVENGGSLEECIQREIMEELGIHIAVGESFGVYNHAYTHFRVTLHAYFCVIIDGVPSPHEAPQLIWVIPEEMISYPMGKIDRQIATRLTNFSNIGSGGNGNK